MMRSAFPRKAQFVAPKLSCQEQQRRTKMFERRLERGGKDGHYYVLKRGGGHTAEIPADKLFMISDLLLDLDAEDNRQVRPFDAADEAKYKEVWNIDQARLKRKTWVQELKERVDWTREKMLEASMRPVSAWVPGNHDILSVALRGAPATMLEALPQINAEGNEPSPVIPMIPDQRKGSDIINTICSENGITDRALENDDLLLHWFRMRQGHLDLSRRLNTAHPPTMPLIMEIREAQSIASLRRLVSRHFSSDFEGITFYAHLSYEVRDACIRIIAQDETDNQARLEVLAFLGNLKERLSSQGAHIGWPLWGLCLRLSAVIATPQATMEYFKSGIEHDLWIQGAEAVDDVVLSLGAYFHHLSTPSGMTTMNAYDRQTLLHSLTDTIGECEHASETKSFRSLFLLPPDSSPVETTQQALNIYKTYILLLGHLGAVRTLWKEWHFIAPEGRDMKQENSHGTDLTKVFIIAAKSILAVAAPCEHDSMEDLDFVECVDLDSSAIEDQDTELWLKAQKQEVDSLNNGDIREALGCPLDTQGTRNKERRLPRPGIPVIDPRNAGIPVVSTSPEQRWVSLHSALRMSQDEIRGQTEEACMALDNANS
ncbi:hypothetical protein G7046_g9853 [Stylonectria norvegica]|nr:hypothetical protein G7046_g9853 [Stylonectria norvegica]